MLEALNCRLENMTPDRAQILLEQEGGDFCFLFAQTYHPAMKLVAGPRKELGVRTIFNM